MSTQPEALRMAEMLMMSRHHIDHEAAAELRRLFELAHDQHSEIYGLRLQVKNLHALNQELLDALIKISRTEYHIEMPPIESLEEQMRRMARVAIARAQGETK
jgi:hypothetical protein